MSVRLVYLVTLAALIGCASASSTSGTSRPTAVPRKSNILTAEEIATFQADVQTAYEAVARLRPNWMAAHGVTSFVAGGAGTEYARVFVDGQHYGGLESLRNLQAYQVGDIRYYNVAEAGGQFGILGGSSGVIEVSMKSPSRR